jgi:hypothetical protein
VFSRAGCCGGIDHDRHKALSGARNEEYVRSKLSKWQIGHTRRDALIDQLQAAGVTHPNSNARSVPPGGLYGVRVDVETSRLPATCQQFTKDGS